MFGLKKIKYVDVIKDVDEEHSEYMNLFRLGIRVPDEKKREQIFKDAMLHKYGLDGEKKVIYELKNSFIPMHIFHNVRFEEAGYVAQIDIIAITNYYIFFIETKQLISDIEITEKGEFIRHFKNSKGRYYKKEGIYSPSEQVWRQRDIFDEIAKRHGAHHSLIQKPTRIIISNPKAIINKKKAPEVIRERVFRIDQLISNMKSTMKDAPPVLTNGMLEYSDFIKNNHKPAEYDYLKRYGLKEENLLPEHNLSKDEMDEIVRIYREKEDMAPVLENYSLEDDLEDKPTNNNELLRQKLKEYRVEQAKKYKIDLGFVFSNAEMEDIILKKPKTAEAVGSLPGFGPKKRERHADDIAKLVKET